MYKKDLIARVFERTGGTKGEVEAVVNEVFEVMQQALSAGEKVSLTGFGSFQVQERSARQGKNPATGENMEIPARNILKFKPGKRLKSLVREA